MAEQIRCLDLLYPIGIAIPRPRGFSGPDQPSGGEVFSSFLIQAIVRELGLPHTNVDSVFIRRRFDRLTEVTKQQIDFHTKSGKRYEKVERFLSRGGIMVFILAAGTCACDLLFAFGAVPYHNGGITTLTVTLPAIGATFGALAAQGEFVALLADQMR